MLLAHVPHRVTATVTSKGQVTIPAEVRKHLGLSKTDKVDFIIEPEGGVRIEVTKYPTIASLAGAAGSPKNTAATWKEVREAAWEERAKHIMQNG